MHPLMLQTAPLFAPYSRGECALMRGARTQPMTSILYVKDAPYVIREVPTDGILILNGEEVVDFPLTVTQGDLLAWVPGEVC